MLAEFMLTPDALLAGLSGEAGDTADELKGCFLPGRGVPTALVSKLGEEWQRAVTRKIAGMKETYRSKAMKLLERLLDECSVERPSVRVDVDDENGWIAAARSSNSQLAFERIVVAASATTLISNEVPLHEFLQNVSWDAWRYSRIVARDHKSQEPALKCVCAHSAWITIRMPQIRGGSDDELFTVKQVIRLSNRLPPGFPKSAIDLHVCLQRGVSERVLIDGISAELEEYVREGVAIELSLWPPFIGRELIAGDIAGKSSGEQVRRPRWYITMGHVAVGRREANDTAAGNSWSLFARNEAFARHEKLKDETPLRKLTLG